MYPREGRQFNQNYHAGSFSTNINNPSPFTGGFNGQQNYNGGSLAHNYGGKKKREAQFNQNYQGGSVSTNINGLGVALQIPGAFPGGIAPQAGGFAPQAGGFAPQAGGFAPQAGGFGGGS